MIKTCKFENKTKLPFYEEFLKPDEKSISYFVDNIQGPIILFYLRKLHLILECITKTNKTKILFLYRSGLRIYDLLSTYLKSKNINFTFNFDFLKASRLLSIKLLYLSKPSIFLEMIKKNYANPSEACLSLTNCEEKIKDFHEFFSNEKLRKILMKDAITIHKYYESVFKKNKNIVLIDEGWSGSLTLPLEITFPDYNFITLFFCAFKNLEINGYRPKNLRGIIFESPTGLYDPIKKESCLIFHRHWIESFFEPSQIPSITSIDINDISEKFQFDESIISHIDDYVDKIYVSVKKYIIENSNMPLQELLNLYKEAFCKLHDMIIHPTLEDIKILKGKFRSHDLGKKGGLYSIFPPFDRFLGDTPEQRIKDALWPFGQILLEYPDDPVIRSALTNKIIKTNMSENKEFYFSEFKSKNLSSYLINYIFQEEIKLNPEFKTAIIMRTKDRPLLLQRAVTSVQSQQLQNYVLVVVNDGGNINEVIHIIKKSNIDPSKVLIVSHKESKGMEAASNAGIKAVESKFIVIHDDDDTWDPQFLRKAVTFLLLNPDYKGVITKSYFIDEIILENGQIIERAKYVFHEWVERIHLSEICIQNLFPPIAFLYDREVYNEIGGYDESLPVLGDWDFNIRFLMVANIGVIKEVLANYHVRTDPNSVYPSSLSAGRNLHFEYNAILRNKYIKKSLEDNRYLVVAQLFNQGYYQEDNRYRFHMIQNK